MTVYSLVSKSINPSKDQSEKVWMYSGGRVRGEEREKACLE